jgi:hypothetical protein
LLPPQHRYPQTIRPRGHWRWTIRSNGKAKTESPRHSIATADLFILFGQTGWVREREGFEVKNRTAPNLGKSDRTDTAYGDLSALISGTKGVIMP